MVTGNRSLPLPPQPPRLPNTEKVVDYQSNRTYDRYGNQPASQNREFEPLPERPSPTRRIPQQHINRGPPPSAKYDNIENDPSLQLGGRVIDYQNTRNLSDDRDREPIKDSYYPSGITYGGGAATTRSWR